MEARTEGKGEEYAYTDCFKRLKKIKGRHRARVIAL